MESALQALSKAIANLRNLSQVQSAADVRFVTATLHQLQSDDALPGYTTPEQLVGLDCQTVDWSLLANSEYAALLTQLGRLFTLEWPQPSDDVVVLNIFKLDFSIEYTQIAFEILQQQLVRVPVTAGCMLAALLKDECLIAISLLNISRQRGALMQRFARTIKVLPERLLEELDAHISQFIQLLIGLPSQVANKLGRQLPAIFASVDYGRLLLRQWLKALHFVLQCEFHDGYFDLSPFSCLLSRVINNFYDGTNLEFVLRILEGYAVAPKPRIVVQQILRELEPSACFKVAQGAVNAQLNLYVLLGPDALETPNWQYCLLQKLPLQRAPISNDALCKFVEYLNVSAPTRLQALFKQLLGIWSKRLSLQKLSREEHLCISKLLILCGICKGTLELDHNRLLHDGLSHHLQSPDQVQRHVGMKSVEILYNAMEQTKGANNLTFEYDALKDTPHWHILEELDELTRFKFSNKKQLDEHPSQERIQRLEMHIAQFMGDQEKLTNPKSQEFDSKEDKTTNTVNMQLDLDSDDESPGVIDDDDLKPFDMSNDISTTLEQRPRFLLDLLHILRSKVENYQIFEGALGTAEQMIRNQLSQHDEKLALELMQLFITMEMQYYYENFDRTQFLCCVAICVSHPGACAEFLCREFHTDNSRYALKVRILILQVLSAAAKELAGDKQLPSANQQIVDTLPPAAKQMRKFELQTDKDAATERLSAAQCIIRERLRSKTRRFISKSKVLDSSHKAQKNPFHAVAGTFFFGLVRGQRTRAMLYVKYDNIAHDIDTQLLVNMLHTLAMFTLCAQNCPLLPTMTREIFDLCTFVRFNPEARVRAATLQLLGIALVTMPASLLINQFAESLNELQRWLEEFMRSPLVGGESSDECRDLAEQILTTCYKHFQEVAQSQEN